MTRGLPYSLVVHVLVLVLVVVYGNHVTRRPNRLPRAIPIRMVHAPSARTDPGPAAESVVDHPEPIRETPVEEPAPKPEPEMDLPPKQVPEQVREEDPLKEPETEPQRPDPEPEILPEEKGSPED